MLQQTVLHAVGRLLCNTCFYRQTFFCTQLFQPSRSIFAFKPCDGIRIAFFPNGAFLRQHTRAFPFESFSGQIVHDAFRNRSAFFPERRVFVFHLPLQTTQTAFCFLAAIQVQRCVAVVSVVIGCGKLGRSDTNQCPVIACRCHFFADAQRQRLDGTLCLCWLTVVVQEDIQLLAVRTFIPILQGIEDIGLFLCGRQLAYFHALFFGNIIQADVVRRQDVVFQPVNVSGGGIFAYDVIPDFHTRLVLTPGTFQLAVFARKTSFELFQRIEASHYSRRTMLRMHRQGAFVEVPLTGRGHVTG